MPALRVRALIAKSHALHSSRRKVPEVENIFLGVNEIWKQARIRFEVTTLEWEFDAGVLDGVVQAASGRHADTDHLGAVTGDSPRQITAIYLRSIGGSSGKVFRPKKTVLVVDDTKVSDSRTTAHEIGHIFELEHWLDHPPPEPADRPPDQLMARTQPGTKLLPRDIESVLKWLQKGRLDVLP